MMGRPRSDHHEPTVHWVLLGAVMLVLVAALLISGVVNGQVGEGAQTPQSQAGTEPVPPAVRSGGPVIDPTTPAEPGLLIPNRHVVLTFDDGPTGYTQEILDVLQARDVPATFFVVGARAAARPDLIRRMHDEGHEVGVHTFTHVNAANVTPRRLRLELDQSQLAIAGATGHTTSLLRLPYSSGVDGIGSSDWAAIRASGNYRVVYADLDTHDWSQPGVDAIIRAGLPADGRGAIVMLHDGGGDRTQTVAALDGLITELMSRGYVFDTVTGAVGLSSPWHAASGIQRLQGEVVSVAVRAAGWLTGAIKVAFLVLAALAVVRTLLLLALARRHARLGPPGPPARRWRLPPVSVIVPAYNEEVGIAATVRSMIANDYPDLEVIVVDDGSTDATAAVVAALGLEGVRLIRQVNAGKPAALSTGIAAARHDVLVLVDGDTVFEPEAIRALVAPFTDPDVGAVSGNTKVGNRRGLLGRWQHIEYVIGFNLDRRMFDVLRCMPTVPGAIGAFRRDALADAGGLARDTLAEDTDLTMASHPGRLAGGVRARGPSMDRSARHPRTTVASALPLVLRDHASDVEAPRVSVRVGAGWSARAPRAAIPARLPGGAAVARAGRRRGDDLFDPHLTDPRHVVDLAGLPGSTAGRRRVRVPAGSGAARAVMEPAPAAVRLPAADVPGGDPVTRQCPLRATAALAGDSADWRDGRGAGDGCALAGGRAGGCCAVPLL